jgi:acyl-homoserine lactone acylase PvdQ
VERLTRGLTLAVVLLALVAGRADAAATPAIGGFHSVLAGGEGQTVNAADLAQYEASHQPPARFVDQMPLYDGVMPHASTLKPGDIDTYYKPTAFGSMPGGAGSTESPRAGVTIVRDKSFGMAHITGTTRADVMFGAGYATAEERLFLMDALRHTAEGSLAALTGAGAAKDDAAQLTDQDFSPAELTKQFEDLPSRLGADGARAHQDILDYVAGINAYIDDARLNPAKMPAEYAALGVQPAPWTVADTAAEAVLLVTQFTVSNGGEERNQQIQLAFRKRFGKSWRKPYGDLREAEDPEAFTVAKAPFLSDRPGKVRSGRNVALDAGSIKPRNTIVSGPGAGDSARAAARMPAWVRAIDGLKASLPHVESNAVMVSGRLSKAGTPLAAMGPQVGYYSPQIFSEYELHGGGIDVEGVSFPGASPWPLIGHGIDFAWSGTSANGDNQDTFVETLCDETHYRYKGSCVPFTMREQDVATPLSPLDPTATPQTIKHQTMRSVHGPVFAFATVKGKKVALAKAKAVDFHELEAVLSFMRMAENHPTDAKSFMKDFSSFPGTENWFYADNRQVAFQQSGRYPMHARGSDVDLPFNGDGSADWQGFDPAAYTAKYIPASHRPRALEPRQGFIISWNDKEARGWRKGPTEWSDGSVHHAMILQRHLVAELKAGGGKTDLTGLTRAVNEAATTDLRGEELVGPLLTVIGRAPATDAKLLRLLRDWRASGANRLDADGDNVYDHSAAVALMDAWWPLLVRAEFQPSLGKTLFDAVESDFLGLNGTFSWRWASQVRKDLRATLGAHVVGRYSRLYCGKRPACARKLLGALHEAVAALTKKYGSADPASWKVAATCSGDTCDQNTFTAAGAVQNPPFPWQNRGTYHQVVEVAGRR